MGTWGVGLSDNDEAADLAVTLDERAPGDRETLVRKVLERAVDASASLHSWQAQEAVAASALIAAQCPGGRPASVYGPSESVPEFPDCFRMLAVDALDRVAAETSELAGLWAEAPNGREWRRGITQLREVLAPPILAQEEALFEVQIQPLGVFAALRASARDAIPLDEHVGGSVRRPREMRHARNLVRALLWRRAGGSTAACAGSRRASPVPAHRRPTRHSGRRCHPRS